jgi:hypothetical protein
MKHFKSYEQFINEAKMPGYNLGMDTKKNWEYEKIIGKAIEKLPGIDAYTKAQQRGGKWAVQDMAYGMVIKQYGKDDNTSKLKSILSKIDPNIDVSTLKNNFKSGPSSRSQHEQDNDIWTYEVRKKKDYHQFKKGMASKGEPDTEMSRDVVMDILDMMAAYSTTQDQLANQEWTRLKDLVDAARDHVSPTNHKKLVKQITKKYPNIKESVNESKSVIQKLFKSIKKKLGMSKIGQATDAQYEYARDWISDEFGEGHTMSGLGVDSVQDIIHIDVMDVETGKEEEIELDIPKNLRESVNEGYNTFKGKMKKDLTLGGKMGSKFDIPKKSDMPEVTFKKGEKVDLEIQPNSYHIYGKDGKHGYMDKQLAPQLKFNDIDDYVIYESVNEYVSLRECLESRFGDTYMEILEDLSGKQQYYWAMHADLYDKLAKAKDIDKEVDSLLMRIKNDKRKEALEYFYDIVKKGPLKKKPAKV